MDSTASFTVGELATMARRHKRTILRQIKSSRLKARRVGIGYQIDAPEARAYLNLDPSQPFPNFKIERDSSDGQQRPAR